MHWNVSIGPDKWLIFGRFLTLFPLRRPAQREKNTSNMADVRRWRHRVTSLQVLFTHVEAGFTYAWMKNEKRELLAWGLTMNWQFGEIWRFFFIWTFSLSTLLTLAINDKWTSQQYVQSYVVPISVNPLALNPASPHLQGRNLAIYYFFPFSRTAGTEKNFGIFFQSHFLTLLHFTRPNPASPHLFNPYSSTDDRQPRETWRSNEKWSKMANFGNLLTTDQRQAIFKCPAVSKCS
jgi:hypothetical protein